jgi:oxalate---CoA ligase
VSVRRFQFAAARSISLASRMNIAQRIAQNRTDAMAFVGTEGVEPSLTYGDVTVLINALARTIRLADFSSSDRIAVMTPRGKDGLLAFLAISSYATCCPLDPRLTEDELALTLRDLKVVALVDATGETHIGNVAHSLGIPVRAVRLSALSPNSAGGSDVGGATGQSDVALLLQTSGTTSKPKHVALTHANILAAAQSIGSHYSIGRSDLCINPMPHHHVHGLISAGISSLLAGAAQFCASSFAPQAFDSAFQKLNPTWFTGSPAFHLGLLDYYNGAGRRPPPRRSLRFIRSSSAPFPSSAISRYEELFGAPLLENYGMTETASTICSNLPGARQRKPGSVGIPIGAEIRIAVGPSSLGGSDGVGEILLRGPSVITNYASGESGADYFDDGWLRTGDVGRIDEDGFLYVIGRSKELIKRGGHSVYPLEVDSAILANPDVAEAISFSLEHPTLGEELVAAFVPRVGAEISGDDVKRSLEGKLSTYKIPIAVLRVAEIPKNATGKTARRSMRSAFSERFCIKGVAAASELESELLKHWRLILSEPHLGVTDNVFVHGADPMRAQRFSEEIGRLIVRRLPVKDVIRNPTVREQALLLVNAGAATGDERIES